MLDPSSRYTRALLLALAVAATGGLVFGQAPSAPASGTVEVIQIRSRAIEGNLIGDSATRDVSVYLPPGYAASGARRYPVVYMLHGFTDSDAKWFGRDGEHWINLPEVLDRSMSVSGTDEMIVVMPNAFNTFEGSFYTSSVTTGDWETFVAEELVAEIDRRYRTLATRASRGLAGHSMGGYGAVRIGMKRPDVFSSVYAMSSCCLTPMGTPTGSEPSPAEAIAAAGQIAGASFGVKAALASASAWSPNPENPPLYLDLPSRGGQPQPEVIARFAANAPVAMVPQYVFNLRRLTALGLDVGTRDGLLEGSRSLDRVLSHYRVPHVFETYDGDHLSGIAMRIETTVMPFFSQHLADR